MMSTSLTDNPAEQGHGERRRCALLWAAAALILAVRLVMLSGFAIDDAYISFRYARNLAEGRGLVFNAGERVEGYSNLLWVLSIAPFIRAGADPLVAARLLSILCACATFVLLLRLSAEVSGSADVQGALAPIGLALNSSFVLWALGGLETQLMALGVTGLAYAVWRARDGRVPLAAVLLAAMVVFVRPEGVAYGIAASVSLLAIRLLARESTGWRWCAPAAAGLAAAAGHTAWRLWYYGDAMPNVFYAKTGATLYLAGTGLDYAYSWVSGYAHLALAALPAVTWLCRPRARPMLVAAALLGSVTLAFTIYAGGDWMPGHRFLVPAMPLAYLCLQEGARDVLHALALGRGRRIAAIVGLLGWTLFLFHHCVRFPEAQGHALSFGQEAWLARQAGEMLAKQARPDAAIAVADAGSIPYFSRLKVIDRRGLMDRRIAQLRRSDFMWKCDESYVLAQMPDYVESQLDLSAALPGIPDGDAETVAVSPYMRSYLRRLPPDVSLSAYARHPYARWPGDMQLYSSPEFLSRYCPVLIYEVPGLWYVVISKRMVD